MRIAYTALHYGSPYLGYAIRSVIDYVDKYYVLYSPTGSHGAKATIPLPLSEYEVVLKKIATEEAGEKLVWVRGSWEHEGQQRDSIYEICPEVDTILVLDYDEIWADVQYHIDKSESSQARYYRVPMIHYWRSFYRAFLHDPAFPTRIIRPQGQGEAYTDGKPINHMGYAIPTELLKYKLHIHGHRGEFRQDDWLNTKWLVNAQKDCHPVGSEFWDTKHVNPNNYMPQFMQKHPYYKKEIIE